MLTTLFLILITLSASAQTSYFAGKAEEKSSSGQISESIIYAMLVREEVSRTWNITHCQLPHNDKCVGYKVSLVFDFDGKWYYEAPGPKGRLHRSEATVEGDHHLLKKFKSNWTMEDGREAGILHLTIDGDTVWREREKSPDGSFYDIKTVLKKIEKDQFETYVRGKSVRLLSMKRQEPKK